MLVAFCTSHQAGKAGKSIDAAYKKNNATELETALSIITTTYLRSEDILSAVKENMNYLNPPVQSVF